MVKEEVAKLEISKMKHPTYVNWIDEWTKFRAAFEGGKAFVNEYLAKYSEREDDADFTLRKAISYCPAHAKSSLLEIKNSIYQRLVTVTRTDGPESYQTAIDGKERGVDLQGRTMDDFIGSVILEELIVMGKVGVYVDKPEQKEGATLADTVKPYLYYYKAEHIKAWTFDDQQQLVSLLLQDTRDVIEEVTGLVTDSIIVFRHLRLTEGGVEVKFYDEENNELEGGSTLDLERIPFVVFEISSSLMVDVADYQIALTNLASSDMKYSVESNFPFYVEQYSPTFNLDMLKGATPGDAGDSETAKTSSDKEITVGTSKGRRYPSGLNQPAFINPSSEPLVASMKKQDTLIKEIKQIINLSITNLEPSRASEDSKKQDDKTLEAGLSYIGMELNYGEREIGKIWAMYEGSGSIPTIIYPTDYKLLTDEERRKEAKDNQEMMGKIPSNTFKKEMAKKIVRLTLGTTATPELLTTINKEIDFAVTIISDPKDLRSDHEAGFVSDQTASQLRGYGSKEYIQAQKDHAKRATRVLQAQTSNADLTNDPDAEAKKKADEQNADSNISGGSDTRGTGK